MPRRAKTPPRRIPPERSAKNGQPARPSREPQPGPSREPQAGPSGVGQRQSRRRSVSEPRRPRSSSSSSSGADPSYGSPRMNRSRSEQRPNSSRRARVGSKALREIARLQLTTNLLIPKLPFARLIREVLIEYAHRELRITPEALVCLQESAEIYLVQMFEDAYRCTLHRDRVTLMPKDMNLALYLRERWSR